MKHPSREVWMSFLYGELRRPERAEAVSHLAGCPECRAQVAAWRATKTSLDAWMLPRTRTRTVGLLLPVVQWAAAAVVALCLGFGAGRLSAPGADPERIRAAIEPALRQQLQAECLQAVRTEMATSSAQTIESARGETRELVASLASQMAQARQEDWQTIRTALGTLRQDQLNNRRDLETVAVLTGASLRQTQQQLYQLADSSRPIPNGSQP
jgi:anti-sigma factor RsiW